MATHLSILTWKIPWMEEPGKDIRAINALSEESAKLGREHDDANVLCLSAELTDLETMKKIAETFLNTPFEPIERRVRRINRLDEEVYD